MTEQQYWVWVAAPDRYGSEDGGEHPDLDPASGGTWWSCHRDTRAGDLAVLYRSREAKDIAYRLRAVGDAYELAEDERATPGLTHACDVEVLDRFASPIPLADLKADAVVAEWPALKASFARGAALVPTEVWLRLMEMAEVSARIDGDAEVVGGELEAIATREIAAGEAAATVAAAELEADLAAATLDTRPRVPPEAVVGAALGAVVLAGLIVWGVRRRR